MRTVNKWLLLTMFQITMLALCSCTMVNGKPGNEPSSSISVPHCATETRDPVILSGCMDFGPDAMTMETRFQRTKDCLVYADGGYARQLKLNEGDLITQKQWSILEDNRAVMLTQCIHYGRDAFPDDKEVKNSPVNILGIPLQPKH
jgi:hypothetical protein